MEDESLPKFNKLCVPSVIVSHFIHFTMSKLRLLQIGTDITSLRNYIQIRLMTCIVCVEKVCNYLHNLKDLNQSKVEVLAFDHSCKKRKDD